MARTFAEGPSITVTVPAGDSVTQGSFYRIDGFIGMASRTVPTPANTDESAEDTELVTQQDIYQTDQVAAAAAFDRGDNVYWDDTNDVLTNTATGNYLIGKATEDMGADGVLEFVMLPQPEGTS